MRIAPKEGVPDYGDRYIMRYPLREWGMNRAECIKLIASVGLPVPPKSACFFCPAMKQIEIEQLKRDDPDLYAMALEMERLYRAGPHFRGDNQWTVNATHKVTKEKISVVVTAESASEARLAFRVQMKDTGSPYQWNVKPSAAVPGLGRTFAWGDHDAA